MNRSKTIRLARFYGLGALLFGSASVLPVSAQTIEEVPPSKIWTIDPVRDVYPEYPDFYTEANCRSDLELVWQNTCFVRLDPVADNNGFIYKKMCLADDDPSICDEAPPVLSGVTAHPYLVCPETYHAVTSGTVTLWGGQLFSAASRLSRLHR